MGKAKPQCRVGYALKASFPFYIYLYTRRCGLAESSNPRNVYRIGVVKKRSFRPSVNGSDFHPKNEGTIMQECCDKPTKREAFSISEVAKLLGIGQALAYQAAESGDLPTVRIGRRILVPRAALESMLAGRPGTAASVPSEG